MPEQGTERRLKAADMSQYNGVAESLNRHLVERTHAMRHLTLYERLHGEKPNFMDIPEYGQTVWVHQKKGSKLDGRGAQGRCVG